MRNRFCWRAARLCVVGSKSWASLLRGIRSGTSRTGCPKKSSLQTFMKGCGQKIIWRTCRLSLNRTFGVWHPTTNIWSPHKCIYRSHGKMWEHTPNKCSCPNRTDLPLPGTMVMTSLSLWFFPWLNDVHIFSCDVNAFREVPTITGVQDCYVMWLLS